MPQLMPLPWLFSFLMVLFFVFMGSFIYSSFFLKIEVEALKKSGNSMLWLW